ncbi:MAG TPA: hypothetical protein VG096_07400 [Bryobacteraceae bacterium]|jgi:hypothetical protein|nr:hypothetical protein [Bryobacteraceae bacterium]
MENRESPSPRIQQYCETCGKRTPHELLTIVAICLVCHDATLMLEIIGGNAAPGRPLKERPRPKVA